MMYFSTFLLAFGLFMLVVVWSLIEIRLESRKKRSFGSEMGWKLKFFEKLITLFYFYIIT